MSRMYVLLLVSAMLWPSLRVNGFPVGANQELATRSEKWLRVHAEVVRQDYCHVDDETFSTTLDLKLRFTNASDRPMILSRTIEPPFIVRVARDVEAGQKNNFLYAPNQDYFVAELPDAPPFGDSPDPKLFALLAPEESFETVVQSAVIGTNDASKATSTLLTKGSYVLQVGVRTWPYEWPYFTSKTELHALKPRWAKYGDLVTGSVYSDFAPFTLPERFKNPPCPLKH